MPPTAAAPGCMDNRQRSAGPDMSALVDGFADWWQMPLLVGLVAVLVLFVLPLVLPLPDHPCPDPS